VGLPIREGVLDHFAGDSAAALAGRRAWVKEPDDERRQAALELGPGAIATIL